MINLEKQIEDWQDVSRLLDWVNKTRGHEQRLYLDQYIEKKHTYQLKYKDSFHPRRMPKEDQNDRN